MPYYFFLLLFTQCIKGNKDDIIIYVRSDKNKIRTDQDAINGISSIMFDLKETYSARLKSNPNLKGKIIVLIDIIPNGSISELKITKNTLNDPVITELIKKNLKKSVFNRTTRNDKKSLFEVEFIF